MCSVSIIIPVYNTEQYLPRCIESILNQSFTDYELLLIDDGSTDGSGALCDKYAEKDGRIRVFHKENGGVSAARNLGLDSANGEWIYFVDSDDEVLPCGLLTLVNCISEEVDIVMGGFIEVDEGGNSLSVDENVVLCLSKKQSAISLYGNNGYYYKYLGYLWNRLLRKSIIQKNCLRFDSSIAIKEDTLFLMQYVCGSNGITRQTTSPVYQYYRRTDSAMGKVLNSFEPKYVDSFYALVKMKREVEATFPCWSEVLFVARQSILMRYGIIVDRMEKYGVRDENLKKRLYEEMKREMGSMFVFKVRRKWRKMKNTFIGQK